MKIDDINKITIKNVSDKELVSLHYRVHLLYGLAVSKKDIDKMKYLKQKHSIIVSEMKNRGITHNSILT